MISEKANPTYPVLFLRFNEERDIFQVRLKISGEIEKF